MALPAKHSYLMGGTFNSAAPILIDGDTSPLQLDSSGNLLVNVVSGTITATNPSVGLTGAAAPTSATEIGVVDSTGKLQHVTGLDLTNAFAVTVAIVDGNGNQITSFGGGTQYIDDAASGAHPTGTLSMGWDSANSVVRALKVDTSQNLLVDVANTSIAVTQSTSPWVISFTAPQHTIVDSGSISATQGTSPWVISFTVPLHVIVDSGSLSVTQGTSPWVISFTAPQHVIVDSGSIAVSGSVSITGTVGVTQSTNPWVVSGAKTPADSYANPTDAEDVFALLGGWDATNSKWQRVQVDTGTGTLKVDIGSNGTVSSTQGTSPWVISFTAPQHVIVDSGSVSVSGSVSITGTVGVTQSTSPWVVAGNLTHNNAAPAATEVGVLVGLANAAAPTFTEGDQVLLSTDLAGNLRVKVLGTLTHNNAAPVALSNVGVLPAIANAARPTYAEGDQVLLSTDLSGSLRVNGPYQSGQAFSTYPGFLQPIYGNLVFGVHSGVPGPFEISGSGALAVFPDGPQSQIIWNSSTAVGNAQTIFANSTFGEVASGLIVSVDTTQAETVIGGLFIIETADANQDAWVPVTAMIVGTQTLVSWPFTPPANGIIQLAINISGMTNVRARLITALASGKILLNSQIAAMGEPLMPVVVAGNVPVTQLINPVTQQVNPWIVTDASNSEGVLQQLLLIAECTRRAVVALACEGGRNKPIDFDPTFVSVEEGVDDYAD